MEYLRHGTEYVRRHLVLSDVLGESIWQWKWAVYGLSLFFSLLIPLCGPADSVVQRFFDESEELFAFITVVDWIYVLWLGAFICFGCMSVRYSPHPSILRLLQYVVSCTIPQYLFGPFALWVGKSRGDSRDYFHLWLAPSFTIGVIVGRVVEHLIPVREVEIPVSGKLESGKDLMNVEKGDGTIEYPSTWLVRLSGQSRGS